LHENGSRNIGFGVFDLIKLSVFSWWWGASLRAQLFTFFSDNPVSGAIQDIGKDIMDDAYIVIGGGGFLIGY